MKTMLPPTITYHYDTYVTTYHYLTLWHLKGDPKKMFLFYH